MECGPRRPRPGTLHKCRGPESLQPGSPESVSASERTAVTPPASWPRLQQLCGEAGWGGGTVVWGAQFPRELPPLPGHARGSLLAGRRRRPRIGTAGGGSASPIGWRRGSTPDCDPKGDPEPFGVTCPHNAVMPEAFAGSE